MIQILLLNWWGGVGGIQRSCSVALSHCKHIDVDCWSPLCSTETFLSIEASSQFVGQKMHPQSPWWLGTPRWMCNVLGEFNNRPAKGLFCKRMLLFCTRRRHFLPACQGHPLLLSKRSLVSSRKRWKNQIWFEGKHEEEEKSSQINGNVGICFRMSFSSALLFPCFIIIIFQPWFYCLYLESFGLSRLPSTCQPS